MNSDSRWQHMVDCLSGNVYFSDKDKENYGVAYVESFLIDRTAVKEVRQYDKRNDRPASD